MPSDWRRSSSRTFSSRALERVIAARGLDVRQIWRLRVVRLRHGPSGFRQAEALAFDRGAQGGERAMGGRDFLFDRIDRVDLRERAPQLLHGGASFRFGAQLLDLLDPEMGLGIPGVDFIGAGGFRRRGRRFGRRILGEGRGSGEQGEKDDEGHSRHHVHPCSRRAI